MKIQERIAKGGRRCACQNLQFNIKIIEIKRQKRRHKDSFQNLIANAMLGIEYKKPKKVYQARCSQCNKLYLACDFKKELIASIEEAGININNIL